MVANLNNHRLKLTEKFQKMIGMLQKIAFSSDVTYYLHFYLIKSTFIKMYSAFF